MVSRSSSKLVSSLLTSKERNDSHWVSDGCLVLILLLVSVKDFCRTLPATYLPCSTCCKGPG
jgi:hypothetical protein